jgi:dTDP-4-amino-4,6-dideoxygalactose transaminase
MQFRSSSFGQEEKFLINIPSMSPFFTDEDIQELLSGFEQILRSGKLTLGKYTAEFEEKFAKYVGVKYAVATNSGTSSLEAIYRSLGIEGKEVITPTNTHIATSNAVIFAGGIPVLTDIDEESLCMSFEDLRSKIGNKTKAVVVVHVAGLIHPRFDDFRELCNEKEIFLIEDAAHAHGASKNGKRAGSLGKAGSFSFYPAKVITTIEGGMITTDDEELAKTARELRNHGSNSSGLQVRLGNNWRMSEIHSLIGLVQLNRIDEIIYLKRRIATEYEKYLADEKDITLLKVPSDTTHSYYKYPVILNRKGIPREKVQSIMKKKFGIETGTIYYPPCHLQPVYREMFPNLHGSLPVAEDVLNRTISLPIFASMTEEQAEYVSKSLMEAISLSKLD